MGIDFWGIGRCFWFKTTDMVTGRYNKFPTYFGRFYRCRSIGAYYSKSPWNGQWIGGALSTFHLNSPAGNSSTRFWWVSPSPMSLITGGQKTLGVNHGPQNHPKSWTRSLIGRFWVPALPRGSSYCQFANVHLRSISISYPLVNVYI